MDATLFELHLLGPTALRGFDGGRDGASLLPPKRLALLAWLALETADGFRRRDQIVAVFWPDLTQEAARTQLRKVLSALRDGLGQDAIITRGENEVRIDADRVWCDAVALRKYVAAHRWPEALALYRGELLEGLYPEGVAREFEEWLDDRRKAVRADAALAAWESSRLEEERGDRKTAAALARQALGLAPDDEDGVRRLMTLLDQHGDRGGALRVYSDWQARLKQEYDVEPAPETRKLARKVQAARKGESHETPPPQPFPNSLQSASGTSRPRPRMRRPWVLPTATALGGALLVLASLGLWKSSQSSTSPNSVAVLPIRGIGDPEVAASAESLGEEITTALAMRDSLEVRPTSRTQAALNQGDDAGQVGRRMGVTYLVDGAVQRTGDRLRITLRLVRSRDGVAVWAGSYDIGEQERSTAAQQVAVNATQLIRDRILRAQTTR